MTLGVPVDLQPMEAKPVSTLPAAGWYEPKYDGFRCIAFRDGDDIHLPPRDLLLRRYGYAASAGPKVPRRKVSLWQGDVRAIWQGSEA